MSPDEALARLGVFTRGAEILRCLRAGPVKRSYLVARGRARFVLRVDEPLATTLNLDRRAELQVLRAVARAGLGPEPVAWRMAAPAVLLTRYVPGRSWRPEDLRNPQRLIRLAEILRCVHHLRPAVPGLPLAATLRRYAAQAGTAEARELAAEAAAMLAQLRPRRSALCHHDPIAANVVGLRRTQLIDWEYAALGDPVFDLAVVVRHHALPEQQTELFQRAYSGVGNPVFRQRLTQFAAVYDRVLALWLLVLQREHGLGAAQRALLAIARRRIRAP